MTSTTTYTQAPTPANRFRSEVLLYCEKHHLRVQQDTGGMPVGTYRRLRGVWWLRVKRRTGGRTWKMVDKIPKEIKAWALIQGIQL